MSVLGIRNEIHDLAVRYDVRADIDHALAKRIMGTAVMTEASVVDWEKKYPSDNQLARDVYLMQHLYAKIDFDVAREKARYCAQWLFYRYGGSWYAKNLKMTMARDHIPIPSGVPTPVRDVEPALAPVTAAPASSVPSATSTSTEGASSAAPSTTTSGAAKPPQGGSAASSPSSAAPSSAGKSTSTTPPAPSPPPT